jgi:hypothetical protein
MKPTRHKPPHPYALSRYSHHFSPRRYTGPAERIKLRSRRRQLADNLSASPESWALALSCAIALAVVFFDVTFWRP